MDCYRKGRALNHRLIGKVGSDSAAAKCAAATQHESDKFSIEEGKPYAEVCDSRPNRRRANQVEAKLDLDGNASDFTFKGASHSTEPP